MNANLGVVAVTGATGFVGRVTLDRLLEAGWHVRALARREQPKHAGVTWVYGSLEDMNCLEQLCAGAGVVLHIAGVVNAPDAAGFETGNVTGTANMLAATQDAGIRRFVHVSSLSAREPQLSVYGASKSNGEKLVSSSMLEWTIVRPPGVYGPGDTEMFDMFRMAAKGLVVLPPKGRVSLIHVDDLARLLVALLPAHDDTIARIFEADDGVEGGWSHDSFARAIGEAMGRRVKTVHAPPFLLRLAAHGDRLFRGRKAKLTPDRASYLSHPDWTIHRDAAPPVAVWTPQVETRAGLNETAHWYKSQGWL